jgi:hypothetical protein
MDSHGFSWSLDPSAILEERVCEAVFKRHHGTPRRRQTVNAAPETGLEDIISGRATVCVIVVHTSGVSSLRIEDGLVGSCASLSIHGVHTPVGPVLKPEDMHKAMLGLSSSRRRLSIQAEPDVSGLGRKARDNTARGCDPRPGKSAAASWTNRPYPVALR